MGFYKFLDFTPSCKYQC